MGFPKLLMSMDSGTILEQTVDNFLDSKVNETIVVLGYKADEMVGRQKIDILYSDDETKRVTKELSASLLRIGREKVAKLKKEQKMGANFAYT